MRETALALAQGIFPRLKFLGEPVATVGPFQSMRNIFRVGEQLTEVLPNERVKLLGRTITASQRWSCWESIGWTAQRHM